MENTLRLYRRHTAKCTQGYTKPIFDGDVDKSLKDCSCPLCVVGYLKNELNADGKQRRIKHFPVQTTDWEAARIKRDGYIVNGSLKEQADDLSALQADKVTVEQAVEYFFKCGAADGEKGRNTIIKYNQLLRKRLLPWCAAQRNPIRLIKRFDDMLTVREFYNSWKKRKNVDNNRCMETSDGLKANTKRAMKERYSSFLGFCKDNDWIKMNHAKNLKSVSPDVPKKYAWTMDEYENIILPTLEFWHDEHGRTGEYESVRQMAYCLVLRHTGQRISDVSMIGPSNLVEDNEGDVRLTKEVFKDSKVRNNLIVANNGVEALACLRKQGKFANTVRPDLILLDLNLPVKDGRAVLAEIKEDPDFKRIPVVILTTSKAEEDILKTYNLHANCYVTKPVDLDQFVKVVRSLEDFWLAIVKLPNHKQ